MGSQTEFLAESFWSGDFWIALYLIKFDQRDFILMVCSCLNTLLLWHHAIKCYLDLLQCMFFIVCGFLHSCNRKFTKLFIYLFFFQCFVNLFCLYLQGKIELVSDLAGQTMTLQRSVLDLCSPYASVLLIQLM